MDHFQSQRSKYPSNKLCNNLQIVNPISSYKKGHSEKGHHDIHKKDDEEKKKEFYDDDHDSAYDEKKGWCLLGLCLIFLLYVIPVALHSLPHLFDIDYTSGDFHESYGSKKGGSFKKGHKKGYHEQKKGGKKGSGKKGEHHDDEKGTKNASRCTQCCRMRNCIFNLLIIIIVITTTISYRRL